MAKGPGVSATSHIIATSQTNIQYYIGINGRMQHKVIHSNDSISCNTPSMLYLHLLMLTVP